MALCLGGLLNWATLVPLMVTGEFRYLVPTIFCLLVALAQLPAGLQTSSDNDVAAS